MPAFRVSRSTTIQAAPESVFETVRDFAGWKNWSPWLIAEPEVSYSLFGDPKDLGGGFRWDGRVIGAGEMQHAELNPPGEGVGSIRAKLRFLRPWKSEADVMLRFSPATDDQGRTATEVSWDMDSQLPIFLLWMKPKLVGMIGMDYDRGLRMLKESIETGSISSQIGIRGIASVPERHVVGLSGQTTLDNIGPHMEQTMDRVKGQMDGAGISPDGEWLSTYDHLDFKTHAVNYTSGMVLPEDSETPPGLSGLILPAGRAMHVTHIGRYDHLGNAWYAAYQHVQAGKQKPARTPGFEVYVNRPEDVPANQLVTEVFLPVR